MKKINITNNEFRKIIRLAESSRHLKVALMGALSEIRIKEYLINEGHAVTQIPSDNRGMPDFIVDDLYLEHKRAKSKKANKNKIQAEFHKSRGKKPDRLYDKNFSDVVSVDVSEHTGNENDYRFKFTSCLEMDKDFSNKIKSIQTIDDSWSFSLKDLTKNEKR
jgi:hypothetical protein